MAAQVVEVVAGEVVGVEVVVRVRVRVTFLSLACLVLWAGFPWDSRLRRLRPSFRGLSLSDHSRSLTKPFKASTPNNNARDLLEQN